MKLKDQKAESGEQGEDGKAKSTRMDTCRCRAPLLEHVSQADGRLLKWMYALSQNNDNCRNLVGVVADPRSPRLALIKKRKLAQNAGM